eukprot:SAG31_NODE_636_length_13344_cov_8.492451_12_plen_77_part_00
MAGSNVQQQWDGHCAAVLQILRDGAADVVQSLPQRVCGPRPAQTGSDRSGLVGSRGRRYNHSIVLRSVCFGRSEPM